MKNIYIAVKIAGRGIEKVMSFNGASDYRKYAQQMTERSDTQINESDSISTICDKMYDNESVCGSNSSFRVLTAEAKQMIKDGADDNTSLFW